KRKIMVYAREALPKIGYSERIEIMNPMVRGLIGEKMSSSIEGTKIDLLDDEESVQRKVNKAECVAGEVNNGILALVKYIFFEIKEEFVIERAVKFGGNIHYRNYSEVEKDFQEKKLHPLDLKNAVSREINNLLKKFRESEKLKKLYKEAYS